MPASGAPAALPTVNAEPYSPITSPRTRSGASRLTVSADAASVGAHIRPAGTIVRHSAHQCPARPMGTVATPSNATPVIGGSPRQAAPWANPPESEASPHAMKTSPDHPSSPERCNVATSDTSVP